MQQNLKNSNITGAPSNPRLLVNGIVAALGGLLIWGVTAGIWMMLFY